MSDPGLPRRNPTRVALGVAVLAVHGLVITALARTTFVKTANADATPIVVDLIEQPIRPPEVPRLLEPALQPAASVPTPIPEISLPLEATAITVTARDQPPAPPAPTSLPHPSGEPPAMSEVAYLKQPAPRYPAESRHAREEGLVILRVLVDESGHAREIDVVRSSGHPRLDDAARMAVERALFKPYMDGGIARAATAMVPVEFSLHHSS